VWIESAPTLGDLDGDSDLDAVVGGFDGTLHYYQNTGTASATVYVAQTGSANPFTGIDVGLLSTPTLGDLDGDGDLDAVVGRSDGTLRTFLNVSPPKQCPGGGGRCAQHL
jgi:FG-GAP-like repeat